MMGNYHVRFWGGKGGLFPPNLAGVASIKTDKTEFVMKSIFILLIVFLLAFQSTHSQASINIERKIIASSDTTEVKSFEPIYFILGTLSDYMGRFQYVEREKQVDRYYPYEKPLAYYLTDYIKAELNIVVDTAFEKSKHSEMFFRGTFENFE